jgi:CubicO group peptidase (beta-lactamase class C family)
MTRRSLLLRAASVAAVAEVRANDSAYDNIVQAHFEKANIAGLQAGVIEEGKLVWSKGYGFADIERRIAMTTGTVMNVASVSKTVTATAVMQLCEKRRVGLDEDVNRYLPFRVRNPRHASDAITVRHLLTHTSSIADGPTYWQSYVCGDSALTLHDWLSGYLASGGRYYSEQNFHPWSPGERLQYCNVGFGLLGYIVEAVSGRPFAEYCDREIFRSLGMRSTSFGPAKVPAERQAVPYTRTRDGKPRDTVVGNGTALEWNGASYIANCLYSFPNSPDGLIRTCVDDFSHFAGGVASGGRGILRQATLAEMLQNQFPQATRPRSWAPAQGLAWVGIKAPDSGFLWLHTGSDPGVRTVVMFDPSRRNAALLFANTAPADGLSDLAGACLRQAARR